MQTERHIWGEITTKREKRKVGQILLKHKEEGDSQVSAQSGERGKDDENTGSWWAKLNKTRHSDSYAREKKYRKKDNQLGKNKHTDNLRVKFNRGKLNNRDIYRSEQQKVTKEVGHYTSNDKRARNLGPSTNQNGDSKGHSEDSETQSGSASGRHPESATAVRSQL